MANKKQNHQLVTDLINLAHEYLAIKDTNSSNPIFMGDLYFILPSIKKSISLFAAIEEDVESKRLLSATILSRTLIEVVVTLLYVVNVKKTDGFYDKFMEHGRLRIRRPGKGWEKVTIASQISWVEENYKITNLQAVYDNCSKLVHFSSSGMQLILDRRDGIEPKNVKIVISPDESYFADKNFSEITKTCEGMLMVLREHMKAQVKGKRLKVGIIDNVEPEFEISKE